MTEEEALEYFDLNVITFNVEDHEPIVIDDTGVQPAIRLTGV